MPSQSLYNNDATTKPTNQTNRSPRLHSHAHREGRRALFGATVARLLLGPQAGAIEAAL